MKTKIISFVLIMILLIPAVSALNNQKQDKQSARLITYNSVLQMSYDENAVNNAVFQPDGAPVSIPLIVKFKVEIPKTLLSNFILRILFLQTFMITSAKIKLSVANAPDWATITITNPNIYVNISPEFTEFNTSVIIALHSDAPSQGYDLRIKAETESLLNKHVPPNSAELSLVFRPNWVLLLEAIVAHPSVSTPPNELTLVPINITNLGNVQSLITAKINISLDGWEKQFVPSQMVLNSGETGQMTLLLIPPEDFQGIQSIEMLFNATKSPPSGEYEGNDNPLPVTISVYYIEE
ncbi:MAG: hypothetical protein NT038_00250 [Euryarchaeota archaeon]|nr:hypothetical protein [Euryarchaeota archaeon]